MHDNDQTPDEPLFKAGDQVVWKNWPGHMVLLDRCCQKYGSGPFQVVRVAAVNRPQVLHPQYVWILDKDKERKFSGAFFVHAS